MSIEIKVLDVDEHGVTLAQIRDDGMVKIGWYRRP